MIKKKLNVAIFHLAFFYSGGGEKLVLEEITELQKRGHNVVCFTPVINSSLCYPDIIKGFPIKQIFPNLAKIFTFSETLQIIFSCIFFPFIAWQFLEYDVILGANQPGPWFAWLLKKIAKKPYVVYLAQPTRILYPRKIDNEVGVWVRKKSKFLPYIIKISRPFIHWADNISIRDADKVLVNGKYMSKILKRVYKCPNIVCPAGAHPEKSQTANRFAGDIKVNGYTIQKPYILLTNRHFPHKKFEYALYALEKIIKKIPNARLVITGNPTAYTKALKDLAHKLKIGKKTLFTGFIKEGNLRKLYQNASVYIYTSPEEDFGMGVIEAMAVGVPVVAWDNAGPSTTLIDKKTGYLVKPFSQNLFQNAICQLLINKNSNNLMGKNGIELVRRNFSYQKHVDILENALIGSADLSS
jgi:glycosyltransferase involved in cell wall biosynthesis